MPDHLTALGLGFSAAFRPDMESPYVVKRSLICVIDDDASILLSLEDLLIGCGYEVACFSAAEGYLAEGNKSACDCVISDVRMTGISGLELLRRIRKSGNDVPVVLISAHATPSLRKEAERLGAIALLDKPFDAARLLDLVSGTLRGARSGN